MNVIAYPVMSKAKSRDICAAFVQGCGGYVANNLALPDSAVPFFYGVDSTNESVWRKVRRENRPYIYSDNSYFDATRGTHFRITHNALQHSGLGTADGKRFSELGIKVLPWRKHGDHIVVCPQSGDFMRLIAGVEFDWLKTTLCAIASFTRRPVLLREWNRDKGRLAATLDGDLENAHALVTWSSAAAVQAVIKGIPVVSSGPSAAASMAGDLSDIENLPTPSRENWLNVLADHQFTIDEMRSGLAWERIQ